MDPQGCFSLVLLNEHDLSEFLLLALAKDSRGERGLDPRMMTVYLLYAY